MKQFKDWRDVRDWARGNKFDQLADRLEFNDRNWWECGEFGRNQVYLCDAIRFSKTERERRRVARYLEAEMAGDW